MYSDAFFTGVLFQIPQRYRFSSKSQQSALQHKSCGGCFRYHKGTDFQANHNSSLIFISPLTVVLDTTKVQIFKQITTYYFKAHSTPKLFQIPQRYRFSSKSQRLRTPYLTTLGCFRYHKGTDFQANHNSVNPLKCLRPVVLDTTKVQIFKQITTKFSSFTISLCCFRYHKGTDFQANHNCQQT